MQCDKDRRLYAQQTSTLGQGTLRWTWLIAPRLSGTCMLPRTTPDERHRYPSKPRPGLSSWESCGMAEYLLGPRQQFSKKQPASPTSTHDST